MTWFEVTESIRKDKEAQLCARERASILEDFKVIQGEIQALLIKNLEGPDNEKIPIQEFNLDTEYAELLKKQSAKKCEETKNYLEALIVAQDKVTQWCKGYFWNRMWVQGKSIWSIFGNFDVQNYALLPEHPEKQRSLMSIVEQRRTEQFLAKHDSFKPWIPCPYSELAEKLSKPPVIPRLEEVLKLGTNLEEEMEAEKDSDQMLADTGSIACNYIELSPFHYTQEERQTFWQTKLQYSLTVVGFINSDLFIGIHQ